MIYKFAKVLTFIFFAPVIIIVLFDIVYCTTGNFKYIIVNTEKDYTVEQLKRDLYNSGVEIVESNNENNIDSVFVKGIYKVGDVAVHFYISKCLNIISIDGYDYPFSQSSNNDCFYYWYCYDSDICGANRLNPIELDKTRKIFQSEVIDKLGFQAQFIHSQQYCRNLPVYTFYYYYNFIKYGVLALLTVYIGRRIYRKYKRNNASDD